MRSPHGQGVGRFGATIIAAALASAAHTAVPVLGSHHLENEGAEVVKAANIIAIDPDRFVRPGRRQARVPGQHLQRGWQWMQGRDQRQVVGQAQEGPVLEREEGPAGQRRGGANGELRVDRQAGRCERRGHGTDQRATGAGGDGPGGRRTPRLRLPRRSGAARGADWRLHGLGLPPGTRWAAGAEWPPRRPRRPVHRAGHPRVDRGRGDGLPCSAPRAPGSPSRSSHGPRGRTKNGSSRESRW